MDKCNKSLITQNRIVSKVLIVDDLKVIDLFSQASNCQGWISIKQKMGDKKRLSEVLITKRNMCR